MTYVSRHTVWLHSFKLASLVFFCAFFHRMKSPMVGGGAIDAPFKRLTPYATAITLRTLHNALLRKAAQFSDLRGFFVLSFSQERKDQRKCKLYCGGKPLPQNRERLIKRNNIDTYFALFLLRQLLEMRCRRKRCTCTSQNHALAPQIACGLLTYTVLKTLG